MQDNAILKSVTETLTGKALHEMVVPIRWRPKISFWERIKNWRSPKPEPTRTLTFFPSVVANQYRIAGEAALLPKELWDDVSMNIIMLPEHQPRIVYMVAAAIQNNHLEPEQELITFIERNLTGRQLREALIASFQTLEMEAFTDTIVLMKGTVNILKTSPNDGSELIASHTAQ